MEIAFCTVLLVSAILLAQSLARVLRANAWGNVSHVLTLSYEEIAADLAGALERTLSHIGVAPPEGALDPVPTMRRQADERSDAWAATYARDALAAAH